MGRALALVKGRPSFAADFEISRGRTTLTEAEARAAGAPAGQQQRAIYICANPQGLSRECSANRRAIFAQRGREFHQRGTRPASARQPRGAGELLISGSVRL